MVPVEPSRRCATSVSRETLAQVRTRSALEAQLGQASTCVPALTVRRLADHDRPRSWINRRRQPQRVSGGPKPRAVTASKADSLPASTSPAIIGDVGRTAPRRARAPAARTARARKSVRFWRRSTSTIEQCGSRSASTRPGSPPPLPRSISRAPPGEGAERVDEPGRVLGRLLDGSGAEESETLRLAQHLDRRRPNLAGRHRRAQFTPG